MTNGPLYFLDPCFQFLLLIRCNKSSSVFSSSATTLNFFGFSDHFFHFFHFFSPTVCPCLYLLDSFYPLLSVECLQTTKSCSSKLSIIVLAGNSILQALTQCINILLCIWIPSRAPVFPSLLRVVSPGS